MRSNFAARLVAVGSLCAAGDMGVTDPFNAFKCNRVA